MKQQQQQQQQQQRTELCCCLRIYLFCFENHCVTGVSSSSGACHADSIPPVNQII
jgi:hypothetical protein